MTRRLAHLLIAFIMAVAAAMPASAYAMPMPSDATGMAVQQPCPRCSHDRTGSNPDKMPACQVLACAGLVAVLPTPAQMVGYGVLRVAYVRAVPSRWTEAVPGLDPFPPRAVVLA